MKPRREVEIKIKIANPRALRLLLGKLGFRGATPRVLERNTLFDFPDGALRRGGCVLRLRTTGGRNVITFKAKPRVTRGHKSREEFESLVEDASEMRRILERVGLRAVFHYRKHRTTYLPPEKSRESCVLVYDETPVGNYIELEGPPRWINQVATQLGYMPSDYLTSSYVTLYVNSRGKSERQCKRQRSTLRRRGRP